MNRDEKKTRVLFVCLGNICRSPMAHYIFQSIARQRGLADVVDVNSTGTGTWNIGKPPHEGTREVLDAAGISYDGHVAKRLGAREMLEYDYIVAMDRSNVDDIQKMGVPRDRIHLLTDFIEDKEGVDVPDPYYHGNFDAVYELVREGVEGVLADIQKERPL